MHCWSSLASPCGGVEWASAEFRNIAYSPHRHDRYAVGITAKGVQSFSYRGGDRHSLAGDAFVLHPDELHDGRQGTDSGYAYRIAYIAPEMIADALAGAPLPFIDGGIVSDPKLKASIAGIFPSSDEAGDPLYTSCAITRLADAMASNGAHPQQAWVNVDLVRLKRIRQHLLEDTIANISIDELEREHGIDRYSLSRQFRAIFGVSPYRFIILRRLDRAKRHIRAGATLSEAALMSGFADQSHMTRQFRAAFGLSPGFWRRMVSSAPKAG